LIWLEGLAGDSTNCRLHIETLLDLVTREPDASLLGLSLAIPGLTAAGLESELQQVLRGTEHRDLSPMLHLFWLPRSEPPSADARLTPAASAALLSLSARIDRNLDDLRRRYVPAVGLGRRP
jgi:hypothetical protein